MRNKLAILSLLSGMTLIGQAICAEPWYGNGETADFYRATHGSEALTEAETKRIAAMNPPKDYGRFYLRYGLAPVRKTLSGIKNRSSSTYSQKDAAVNLRSVRDKQRNSVFAVGYDWNPMRFEIEYVWTKKFHYNADPVFTAPAPNMVLNAAISNKILLCNFYWDYRSFAEKLYPYLVFSAGGSFNTVNTTLSNPQSGQPLTPTRHNLGLALGAGTGLRVGLGNRVFADVHFRYVMAGFVNMKPEPGMYLRGNHSFYWFGVGLLYLL